MFITIDICVSARVLALCNYPSKHIIVEKKMISFLRSGNSTGQMCDSIHGGSDDEGAEQRSLLSASPYRRGAGSVGRSR